MSADISAQITSQEVSEPPAVHDMVALLDVTEPSVNDVGLLQVGVGRANV